jgi:hypothetical protein
MRCRQWLSPYSTNSFQLPVLYTKKKSEEHRAQSTEHSSRGKKGDGAWFYSDSNGFIERTFNKTVKSMKSGVNRYP